MCAEDGGLWLQLCLSHTLSLPWFYRDDLEKLLHSLHTNFWLTGAANYFVSILWHSDSETKLHLLQIKVKI